MNQQIISKGRRSNLLGASAFSLSLHRPRLHFIHPACSLLFNARRVQETDDMQDGHELHRVMGAFPITFSLSENLSSLPLMHCWTSNCWRKGIRTSLSSALVAEVCAAITATAGVPAHGTAGMGKALVCRYGGGWMVESSLDEYNVHFPSNKRKHCSSLNAGAHDIYTEGDTPDIENAGRKR